MTDTRDAYLESQVATAPPHKLHLMLVEGALRFTTQAIQEMEADRNLEAVKATGRAREIVSEVMVSFRTDDQQLSGRVRRIYLFLFRQLTEAQLEYDVDKLRDAQRVLEAEAETWQAVCQVNPGVRTPHQGSGKAAAQTAPQAPPSGGLSLEA